MGYKQTESGILVPNHEIITIDKDAFNGRRVPKSGIRSAEMVDWMEQQMEYLTYGYHKGRTSLTRFHYYFLNFCWFEMAVPGSDIPVMAQPFYTQEDDKVFKAIDEAYLDSLAFLIMTARGFGKSNIISSIIDYHFTLIPNSECIVSASYKEPATTLMDFISKSLNHKPKPFFHNKLYNSADEYIESGYKSWMDGKEIVRGYRSRIQNVIYDNNAGATRSLRPLVQAYEEIGNWSGSASLIDCYNQSEGAMNRGGVSSGFSLLAGTGGNIKSGASKDAKLMIYNPEAFRLYVMDLEGKKRGYFVGADKKRYGFYDTETGISDIKAANADIDAMREEKKNSPRSLAQFVQEYPRNLTEMFWVKGVNIFPQDQISQQRLRIAMNRSDKDFPKPISGDLLYKRDNKTGKIIGVEWIDNPEGKILCLEKPQIDPNTNKPYPNLYIAGVDSIDQGTSDSSLTTGSRFALLVKKRFLNVQSTYNRYVCLYKDRPESVEEAYDRSLKILMWYGCLLNLEYTKIAITSFYKARGQMWRFIMRPAIALPDRIGARGSSLIGTQMTDHIRRYMNARIQAYFIENWDQVYFEELLEEAQEYDEANKTIYDLMVAMGMCEIADEDMIQNAVVSTSSYGQQMNADIGFFINKDGYKEYGVMPESDDVWDRLGLYEPEKERSAVMDHYQSYYQTD